jgi:hypothetical protein
MSAESDEPWVGSVVEAEEPVDESEISGPRLKCGCLFHARYLICFPCMTTNRFAAAPIGVFNDCWGPPIEDMDRVLCDYIHEHRNEGFVSAPYARSVHEAITQLRSQDVLHEIVHVTFMIPLVPAESSNYLTFSFRSGLVMARAWTLYRRIFRRLRRMTLSRREAVSRVVTTATNIQDIGAQVTSYL